VDSAGNAYVTGQTYSADFPTVNALYSNFVGHLDAFVFKLNANGSAPIYSTYLGGSDWDSGEGIAVDSAGNAHVTGSTYSADFPMVNALYPSILGFSDAFVLKLNAGGSALVYSTYLGGTETSLPFISVGESVEGIAVDGAGNAYVTGWTNAEDFPTVNALYPDFSGGVYHGDAFVSKLNADGSAAVYSTYLGGMSDDFGHGIAVDGAQNAYVTGWTRSTDFPTINALYPDFGGGAFTANAFVFKLNADGSSPFYSTYLGGSEYDSGSDIAFDSAGNAYVTGSTQSADFPTVNALYPNLSGSSDAFVFKLNADGSAPIYSTYLGGSDYDYGSGVAVDGAGNAYVTGSTYSADFPMVNALYPSYAGGSHDAFVFKLNAGGSALIYSTYLGGSDWDEGNDIAVDSAGNAHVTGETQSTDFPTVNALDPNLSGTRDAFIVKIAPRNVTLTLEPFSTTVQRGSTLWYRAEATNSTQNRQCFDYWTNVTLPSGATYPSTGALFGPVNVCLDPGQTKGAWLSTSIPLNAPLGTYDYNGFVGPYPDVWDQASFQFQITN
ncbi:MAG: SBBP repeat-containing protein, partial [Pseudomonadota bacterium]|nr:SBBP repeat-containing protein [Pseudomonadota bacterium]